MNSEILMTNAVTGMLANKLFVLICYSENNFMAVFQVTHRKFNHCSAKTACHTTRDNMFDIRVTMTLTKTAVGAWFGKRYSRH